MYVSSDKKGYFKKWFFQILSLFSFIILKSIFFFSKSIKYVDSVKSRIVKQIVSTYRLILKKIHVTIKRFNSNPFVAKYILPRKYPLLIFIIFIILVTNTYFWLSLDSTPLGTHSGEYILHGLQSYEDTYSAFDSVLNLFSISGVHYEHDPTNLLAIFSVSIVYHIFGVSEDIGVMTNFIFLFILLFSIYGIGKSLFNEKTGFFSVLIFISFPATTYLLHSFYTDFVMVSLVALTVHFLLKSDHFTDLKNSIFLGVSLGFTALVKQTFSLFLIVPFIYTLISKKIFSKKGIIGLIMMSLITVLISFISYFSFYNLITKHYFETFGVFAPFKKFSFYIFAIIFEHISLFLFLILIIAIFISFKHIKKKNLKFLISGIIAIPALLSLGISVGGIHSAPALIFFAILSSASILALKNKKLKLTLIIIILVYGSIQYVWFLNSPIILPSSDQDNIDFNVKEGLSLYTGIFYFNQDVNKRLTSYEKVNIQPTTESWFKPDQFFGYLDKKNVVLVYSQYPGDMLYKTTYFNLFSKFNDQYVTFQHWNSGSVWDNEATQLIVLGDSVIEPIHRFEDYDEYIELQLFKEGKNYKIFSIVRKSDNS